MQKEGSGFYLKFEKLELHVLFHVSRSATYKFVVVAQTTKIVTSFNLQVYALFH